MTRPIVISWFCCALELRELAEPDRAAGAADVVDLRATDQVLERGLHRARGLVPAATGVGRGHDLQLLLAEHVLGGTGLLAAGGGDGDEDDRQRSGDDVRRPGAPARGSFAHGCSLSESPRCPSPRCPRCAVRERGTAFCIPLYTYVSSRHKTQSRGWEFRVKQTGEAYEVVVVGGGNAGHCAALAAAERGRTGPAAGEGAAAVSTAATATTRPARCGWCTATSTTYATSSTTTSDSRRRRWRRTPPPSTSVDMERLTNGHNDDAAHRDRWSPRASTTLRWLQGARPAVPADVRAAGLPATTRATTSSGAGSRSAAPAAARAWSSSTRQRPRLRASRSGTASARPGC